MFVVSQDTYPTHPLVHGLPSYLPHPVTHLAVGANWVGSSLYGRRCCISFTSLITFPHRMVLVNFIRISLL